MEFCLPHTIVNKHLLIQQVTKNLPLCFVCVDIHIFLRRPIKKCIWSHSLICSELQFYLTTQNYNFSVLNRIVFCMFVLTYNWRILFILNPNERVDSSSMISLNSSFKIGDKILLFETATKGGKNFSWPWIGPNEIIKKYSKIAYDIRKILTKEKKLVVKCEEPTNIFMSNSNNISEFLKKSSTDFSEYSNNDIELNEIPETRRRTWRITDSIKWRASSLSPESWANSR